MPPAPCLVEGACSTFVQPLAPGSRRTPMRAPGWVAAGVAAWTCAACADGPAVPTAAAGSRVDGPVIVVTGTSEGGSNASAATGRLSLIDGCLLLGDSVVVWEEGTSWDPDHQEVVLSGGDRLAMGADVLAAGDPVDDLAQILGRRGADAAAACGGAGTPPGQETAGGRRVLIGHGPDH